MNVIETLEQEEWWFGRDGQPHRVAEMNQEYRLTLLAFLRRRADDLRRQRLWYELYGIDTAPSTRARWVRELATRTALDWLNDRPLVRALERAVARHDALDGEVVAADDAPRGVPHLAPPASTDGTDHPTTEDVAAWLAARGWAPGGVVSVRVPPDATPRPVLRAWRRRGHVVHQPLDATSPDHHRRLAELRDAVGRVERALDASRARHPARRRDRPT